MASEMIISKSTSSRTLWRQKLRHNIKSTSLCQKCITSESSNIFRIVLSCVSAITSSYTHSRDSLALTFTHVHSFTFTHVYSLALTRTHVHSYALTRTHSNSHALTRTQMH